MKKKSILMSDLGSIIDINHHVVILLQVLALVMTSFTKYSNIICQNNSQFVKYKCSGQTNTYNIITDKLDSRRELVCGVTGNIIFKDIRNLVFLKPFLKDHIQ